MVEVLTLPGQAAERHGLPRSVICMVHLGGLLLESSSALLSYVHALPCVCNKRFY